MASSVDDKVVAMKFDNNTFEQRVANTIASLGKLKQSLDFSKESKGLQELSSASSSFSLDGIGTAVDNISSKFTAMSAVAFSVIQNITTRALDAGFRIANGFSLKPITDGFAEYETNIGSIQTILANTKSDGTNLEQVNEALNLLNEYSDQTIYNFGQMTKNIGTFTAAGVDLDTSVKSIKGISNLAAISGSNAEQAASAMYQLSQALASGSVKLMDWNSIVNAGMGGEVFQKALFETGKSLRTIESADLGTTFEEWTKAGNSFRGSLEQGWLTSEVLTNTLQGFTGDLNEEQLRSLGYTEQQAKEFMELGKTGKAAATDVKTVTQLLQTIKESIGSGWSTSFKLVLGDFEEAKTLFTELSNTIGGFVKKMSDARNTLLAGWRFFQGREVLMEGLKDAFSVVASIMDRVGKAFREVFPATTALQLAQYTKAFAAFMKSLIPGQETLEKIRRIFVGVFSVFSIGFTLVKEIAGAFIDLFSAFKDTNAGQLLDQFASLGDMLSNLKKTLVDGGGIKEFFKNYIEPVAIFIGSLNIAGAIQTVIDGFTKLREAVAKLFNMDISGDSDKIGEASNRLAERWEWLIGVGQKLADFFGTIKDKISEAASHFGEFFDKIAESFSNGNFEGVYDALNTGLFGGLILIITKFFKDGFKFDFGGGLLKNISGSFEQLTGTLSAMQTSLKADALMKIAIAIGILTASVLVLSLLDSGAITKSLSALAVGFGELVATTAILTKVANGPTAAISFDALAAGLILLSGAVLVLTLAVKVLATMDTGELTRGLTAIGTLLAGITIAVKALPDSPFLIATGLGIVAIAGAMLILAGAVLAFGSMEFETMKQGLIGVGIALTAITVAVNLMPAGPWMVAQGAGMIAIAVALNILGAAVLVFSTMEFDKMVQGLIGIGAALAIIVITMNLMPANMLVTGAGLVAVGVGLNVIAAAIILLGNMELGTMVQGLVGIAAALTILAIATYAMSGSIVGSLAILLAAGALVVMAAAIKAFDAIGLGSVILALVGIAIALTVLGVASVLLAEAVPFIAALGAALLLVGIGAAAIGLGAALIGASIYLIATAIQILVDVGIEGIRTFIEVLPELTIAIASAVLGMITELIDGLAPIIVAIGKVIDALLTVLIEQLPKLGEFIIVLVDTLVRLLHENTPKILAAGYELLLAILHGINDNIEEIVTLVSEIINKFLFSLNEQMPSIILAGATLLITFLNGIAENVQNVVDSAVNIIVNFLQGISDNAQRITDAGGDMIVNFINGLSSNIQKILDAGANLIISFVQGISDNVQKLIDAGFNIVIDFINGVADSIDQHSAELREAGLNLVTAIINGMTGGLVDGAGNAIGAIREFGEGLIGGIKDTLGINSPSKVMEEIAGHMADGIVVGFNKNTSAAGAAGSFAGNMATSISDTLATVSAAIQNVDEFNPTISPVLDLTNVEKDAAKIGSLMQTPTIATDVSYDQATSLANAVAADQAVADSMVIGEGKGGPTEIKLEQNNYGLKLTASELYRQTRNQIHLAKEELDL